MLKIASLNAITLFLGLVSAHFLFAAFFTQNWLLTTKVEANETTQAYGLWDHGLNDLNCDVTPFTICMYTRAGIFFSMILVVPAVTFSFISMVVMFSRGKLHITATFARASAVLHILAALLCLVGLIVFTVHHTRCIISCPPTYNYYPNNWAETRFGYSFYLGWVCIPIFAINISISFVYSAIIAMKYKKSYEVDQQTLTNESLAIFSNQNNRV
ncbi:uncharacterized protein LOC143446827 isoform X1 [Clavelina lepadiformis]|uniref:Uncharacterized protein n=1 Tax=Clavelina lepadiformis TaxID=159417 RepID=A0ABP0GT98_CLALP